MPFIANNHDENADEIVAMHLNGARVTRGFRTELFTHAGRLGLTVNEYLVIAAAEKLQRAGHAFPGVFSPGDFATSTERKSHAAAG